jgi:hypothetical protein
MLCFIRQFQELFIIVQIIWLLILNGPPYSDLYKIISGNWKLISDKFTENIILTSTILVFSKKIEVWNLHFYQLIQNFKF